MAAHQNGPCRGMDAPWGMAAAAQRSGDRGVVGDWGATRDGGAPEWAVPRDGRTVGDGSGDIAKRGGWTPARQTSTELGDECGMGRFDFFFQVQTDGRPSVSISV